MHGKRPVIQGKRPSTQIEYTRKRDLLVHKHVKCKTRTSTGVNETQHRQKRDIRYREKRQGNSYRVKRDPPFTSMPEVCKRVKRDLAYREKRPSIKEKETYQLPVLYLNMCSN